MPTPTSKAETRSERLIRLAKMAAQDLNRGIKPDEASGTPDQINLEFTTPRGFGRIMVGIPGDDILISGILTRTDGTPVRLHRGSRPEVLMTGALFDACSDTSNRRSLEQMFLKLIATAQPPLNKKLARERELAVA